MVIMGRLSTKFKGERSNITNKIKCAPKAEPTKLWLAKVDYERMQEMSDPVLSLNRAMVLITSPITDTCTLRMVNHRIFIMYDDYLKIGKQL